MLPAPKEWYMQCGSFIRYLKRLALQRVSFNPSEVTGTLPISALPFSSPARLPRSHHRSPECESSRHAMDHRSALQSISFYLFIPYGVKTSTEETKNKYTGFFSIYEQKSKLTMVEIWSVILKRSI